MNKSKFNKGQNVRIISNGEIGTINEILPRNDVYGYKVTLGGKMRTYQEKYLEAFVDEESKIIEDFVFKEFGNNQDFSLFQTWYRLKRPIEGNYYSFLGSRTIFNPYQFKPLGKFISQGSEERLFIADEVGVGKTIETGIILTELLARGRLDRHSPILIVCPNSLGPKWVKEMKKRFNFNFHLHDGKSLENLYKTAIDGKIQNEYVWFVASLQLLRHKKFLDLLEKVAASRIMPLWSMVIIDESHHMRNSGTESNNLGNLLSSLTEMMLMLSATPLNLKDADLFNQMNILNPAMFPDAYTFNAMISPVKSLNRCRKLLMEKSNTVYGEILNEFDNLQLGPLGHAIQEHPGVKDLRKFMRMGNNMTSDDIARFDITLASLSPIDSAFTRTLKREAIEHRVTRETFKIPVILTEKEMKFHEDVIKAVKESYISRGGSSASIGFITNMPMRMVSSCIPAMKDYLHWCVSNNKMLGEHIGDAEDDSEINTQELPSELKQEFRRLVIEAEGCEDNDTKYNDFKSPVEQLLSNLENPQIIVFSFFVRTLKYLKKRLEEEGYKVGLICGEVPLVSDGTKIGRYEIMEQFERGEFKILLSSEVGGEGLDFQFCQSIINYDMPYNPMRIEQRIGRLDRFGQKADKIIISNMYIKNTVDEKIYNILCDRIKLVEDSIGFIEPILGNRLADLQNKIIIGELSDEQIEIRTKEIEIAFAQSRIEMEKFETNRKELLGDDSFVKSMANMETTDFVKPTDAIKLTKTFLNYYEGCKYEDLDDNRGKIILSKELIQNLEQYTRTPGAQGCIEELKPLIDRRKSIEVIFNGSQAVENPNSCFLPPCGFWTKFMLKELESRNNIKKVFNIKSTTGGVLIPVDKYVVPFFEVVIEGFHSEINLAAVPVSIGCSQVFNCNFIKFSRVLGRASQETSNYVAEDIQDVESYIDIALETLEIQMQDKMQQLNMENKYKLEARIASLTKGSKVRIDRLKTKKEEHQRRFLEDGKLPSHEFIRLTEAQINNDEIGTEERINKLKDKKELVIAFSMVAIAVVDVGN
ncbi:MAG: superfamily II DNA or RNA helicase [Clostridium sp.]|jgi:superfamily II DNA or RNA helicase